MLERPGGAALAALTIARTGIPVTLAAPLADDADGIRLRQLLPGVTLLSLPAVANTRTLTRVCSADRTLIRYDTPGSRLTGTALGRHERLTAAVAATAGVLVSDYGAGTTAHPCVRQAIERVQSLRLPVVWDPHPRGAAPVPGLTAVTPNRREVELALAQAGQQPPTCLEAAARDLLRLWNSHAVVATDGNRGALTVQDDACLFTLTPQEVPGDACGAGDRFAAALITALTNGQSLEDAVSHAVTQVALWLQAGGISAASTPAAPDRPDHRHLPTTVVATGGCFEVLHAGQVASLQAARQLGDQLVVLLNSDESVRRLKGPNRPVHHVDDRRRVLESLACVDDVIDDDDDDTPARVLTELRPAVWAEGADYAAAAMPEAELLEQWGGRVALLPYLPGHSTTRIFAHAGMS